MKVHCFTDDILKTYDAVKIADLIKKKKISHNEVIQASIDRAQKINPLIHAIASDNFKLEKKDINKSSSYFAGVPFFFKDMVAIKGQSASYGSHAFSKRKAFSKNDELVKQILELGFTNIGMSTMPEFGLISSTEFPNKKNTTNPWNINYSSGGSSGGSAALVAAGVVPIAHSVDGGGSTRIPASCCGLIGLKPTRGRLRSSKMLEKQIHPIATDGIISRSVRDTAFFYQEAEKYFYNNRLPAIKLVKPNKKVLNIGYIEDALSDEIVDSKTIKAFQKTIYQLKELGHLVKPVKFPIDNVFINDFILLWSSNGFYFKHFGKMVFKNGFESSKLTFFTKELSKYFYTNILKAPKMFSRFKKTTKIFNAFLKLENIDIMLTPTVAHSTPKIGYIDTNLDFNTGIERMKKWSPFTPLSNVNGCPSMTLPMQHDTENDLPIGMMFWANFGNDKLLLELAYQIENAFPWKKIYY